MGLPNSYSQCLVFPSGPCSYTENGVFLVVEAYFMYHVGEATYAVWEFGKSSQIFSYFTANLKFFSIALAVLGLCCSAGFVLVAASGGHSVVVVCGSLIVLAPLLVEEHGL